MSEDLAVKLLAAIEEAEELAQQCERVGIGTWSPGDLDVWGQALGNNMMDRCEREHITRHDPAAVLRRCAADREIVEQLAIPKSAVNGQPPRPDFHDGWTIAEHIVLRLLAEGYGLTEPEGT